MTRARDTKEQDRLLRSLQVLSRAGHRLCIADAASNPEFVSQLARLPEAVVKCIPGTLVDQVAASIGLACEPSTDFILYTEPDKDYFFEHGLAAFLERASREPDAVLIVCSRDDHSFRSFPRGQQQTEAAFNDLAAFFLGRTADMLYGPLLLNRRIATHLEEITPDLGWGWRTYLIARCIQLGHPVAFHVGNFPCTLEQRNEDDMSSRLYRLQQLAQNIEGLL